MLTVVFSNLNGFSLIRESPAKQKTIKGNINILYLCNIRLKLLKINFKVHPLQKINHTSILFFKKLKISILDLRNKKTHFKLLFKYLQK